MKSIICSPLIALAFVLSSLSLSSQTLVNVAWCDSTGHPNINIPYLTGKQDSAGNYFIVGNTYRLGYGTDLHVGKYSSSGSEMWSFDYNSGDTTYAAYGVDLFLKSGFLYVEGALWDSINHKSYMLTVKMDASTGGVVWEQEYGGSYGGFDIAAAIKVDDSSNVYAAGTEQTSLTDYRMQVIKYKR